MSPNTPPANTAESGANTNALMLGAFDKYAAYMNAATTPRTKLVSSGSLTRREVLAANRQQHLITVSTSRGQQPDGKWDEMEYVETVPVPLPHERGGLLMYIPYDDSHNNTPRLEDAVPLQERNRSERMKRYGPQTLVDTNRMEWGFAGLIQECVRSWAMHGAQAMPGNSQREKELAFANHQRLALEPETIGRYELNPHATLPLPPGNPFAPLIAVRKMLADRDDDRRMLYRSLGLDMLKMVYALRAKHVADPRGTGLTPEPREHEKPELVQLARVHAEFDGGIVNLAHDISDPVRGQLATTMRTMYAPKR